MTVALADAEIIALELPEALAERLASDAVAVLGERIDAAGVAHLGVSGGSVADRVVPAIVTAGNAAGLDWSRLHVWFVDERFVPRGGADRNATPVVAAMRAADGFDASRLHIAGSDDLGLEIEAAAADYEQRFVRHASPQGTDGVPSLDLALLGMGPDGHTASLFPGQLPAESNALVVAVEDSPKPPPRRLTLTYRALDAAQRAWLFATGESKAQALTLARSGTATPQESPLGRIRAVREVRVYADSAALGTSN